MKTKYNFKIAIALFIYTSVIILQSCFKEEFSFDKLSKNYELTPDFIFPLGHGLLSIKDLVKENDTIRYNADTIEIFMNRDSLLTLGVNDFFDLPENTSQDLVFDLGDRNAFNDSSEYSVTLDELGNVLFPTIKAGMVDGSTSPFPAFSNEQSGNVMLDSMTTFDWVVISSGTMSMTVENNLPVNISSLQINIRNVDDDAIVAGYTFSTIISGGSQTQNADLTGRTLQNETYAEIIDFSTPGSGGTPVLINFQDDLVFTLKTINTVVSQGRAKLPSQIFDTDNSGIQLDLEGDEELTRLEIATGYINFELYSYVEEDMSLTVTLPNTTINGVTVERFIIINEQSENPTIDRINLANSITVLENNTIPAIYTTRLISSGRMVEFDFTDRVDYNSTIERVNVTIRSAQGYFGQDTIVIASETFENNMSLFSKFEGSFELTDPQINIKYSNSYGVPLQLDLGFLGDYFDDEDVSLNPPSLNFEYPINPSDDPVERVVNYNKNNLPEIVDFLKFPPADIIEYSGNAYSNPNGKPPQDNFIHNRSEIVIGLELKLPLEIRADSIILRDTIPFTSFNVEEDASGEEDESFIDIEEALMAFKIKNGFPLDLDFELVLYDSINNINYDTIDVISLKAAPVDNQGIVIPSEIVERSGNISITDSFIENLKYNANKLIYVGKMNTTKDNNGNAQAVKILTSYNIDFKAGLVAKMSIKP